MPNMLNEYHIQFLRHITSQDTRFLIVGGQARFVYDKKPTRDLDIWCDASGENKVRAEQGLNDWRARYSPHINPLIPNPIELQAGLQVPIPDADGCCFLSDDGKRVIEIEPGTGIDFLTSLHDFDFEQCFARSVMHVVDEISLRFLSKDDLAAAETAVRELGKP